MSDRAFAFAFRITLMLSLTALTALGQIQLSKPKPIKPLPNPSIVVATRDELIAITKQMLETREIPLDKEDCNSTTGECTLISKPVIFIRGIAAKSQLEHYCIMPSVEFREWSRGRYVLRFQLAPATTKTAQVGVYAKFEGMMSGA